MYIPSPAQRFSISRFHVLSLEVAFMGPMQPVVIAVAQSRITICRNAVLIMIKVQTRQGQIPRADRLDCHQSTSRPS